jgi:hypothetical protein
LLSEDKQLAAARKEVVLALEEAPRYREAHKLLLEIVSRMEKEKPATSPASTVGPTSTTNPATAPTPPSPTTAPAASPAAPPATTLPAVPATRLTEAKRP